MKKRILTNLLILLLLAQMLPRPLTYVCRLGQDECLDRNEFIYDDSFKWSGDYIQFEDGSILYGVSHNNYYNLNNQFETNQPY